MSLGLGELVVVFIVAYVIVGPENLPKVAKTLAKSLRQLKSILTGVTDELKLEDEVKDIKKQLSIPDAKELNLSQDLASINKELQLNLKDKI